MAAICILTGAHLCNNPRVIKEADTLSAGGHDVTVLSPIFSEALNEQDEMILKDGGWDRRITVDLRANRVGRSELLVMRVKRRLGADAVGFLGYQASQALGYGVSDTLDIARSGKFDFYIAHQEVGTWVGYELSREGKRVGADLEDWYSRDLLPAARRRRPVKLLAKCESHLLNTGSHITTTSEAMASALSQSYGVAKPLVVYNCFPWSDRRGIDNEKNDRVDQALPSLHWVSQTVGPGRGLENLCAALNKVDFAVELHLRGEVNSETEEWLRGLLPHESQHKLYFHNLVPRCELLSRMAEHDIGLALELPISESRNLTVTNKLLHYLLAGIAVVASDTAGQSEISRQAPLAVNLYGSGSPDDLALALNQLLADPVRLETSKTAALNAAKNYYCWERQAPILLESLEMALSV